MGKETVNVPEVIKAKNQIISDINKLGIKKDITISYKERSFKGRSTEIIVKRVAELIAKYHLSLSNNIREFKAEDNRYFIIMEYTLTSSLDNSSTMGIGLGVGENANPDRAIQNACTYAFKHFLTQTFFIAEGGGEEEEELAEPLDPEEEKKEKFRAAAVKLRDEMKLRLDLSPNDFDANTEIFQRYFLPKINNEAFPQEIREQCFALARARNIVTHTII